MTVDIDYVIIGAGLAGTVLQRVLGPSRCVLLDPRPAGYKVGESIVPEQFHHPLLRALAEEAMDLPSYSPKRGTTFVDSTSVAAFPLPPHASEVSMHVARSELEALMHERFGTVVVPERVVEVDIEGQRARTRRESYRARKLLLDCSGPAMVTARALDAVEERGAMYARWAYFDIEAVDDRRFARTLEESGTSFRAYDAVASKVIDSTDASGWECSQSTVLTRLGPGTWTWQIPLFNRRLLSFGLVSKERKVTDEELLDLALQNHSPVYRLRARTRDGDSPYDRVHSRSRLARVARIVASPHHAVVGDAAGFTDPVYSVGTASAVNRAIELAVLLQSASGWDDANRQRYAERVNALRARSDRAFAAWYEGTHLDEDVAKEIRDGFLIGSAFQIGVTEHYKHQLLDASPGAGLGGEHDGARAPLSGGAALGAEVMALLEIGPEARLAGWRLVGAAPLQRGVQLRWRTEGKPEILVHVSFDPEVRYYRRAGRITLSFMNLMEGPYPLGPEGVRLFDALQSRVAARHDDWLSFGDVGTPS